MLKHIFSFRDIKINHNFMLKTCTLHHHTYSIRKQMRGQSKNWTSILTGPIATHAHFKDDFMPMCRVPLPVYHPLASYLSTIKVTRIKVTIIVDPGLQIKVRN